MVHSKRKYLDLIFSLFQYFDLFYLLDKGQPSCAKHVSRS